MQKKPRKRSFIDDTKWVASSFYLAKLITFPCSIVTARLLGPFLYGTWNALRLILFYASFLQLGVFDGMTREIPYWKGRQGEQKVSEYKIAGFSFSLLTGILGMVGILIASFVIETVHPPVIVNGVRAISIIFLFSHLFGFYQYLLKADQNFMLFSRAQILYAFGAAIFQVTGVYLYGINGLFCSVILINLVIFVYLYWKVPLRIKMPSFRILRPLFKTGTPMLLNGMADILFFTVDRLMILAFLGRQALGYYAIAVLAGTLIDFLPTSFQSVLLPRIVRQAGIPNSQGKLGKFWLEPLYTLSTLLPVLVGFGCLLAPMGVRFLLPKYLPGLMAMKILMFGMCFAAITNICRNLFVAVNKQFRVLAAFLSATGMGLALNYLFIHLGYGISGVALATTLSFAFLSVVIILMALHIQKRLTELPQIMARVYGPILAVASFIIALEILFPSMEAIGSDFLVTARKLGFYTLALLPLLYAFHKQTGFFSSIIYGNRTPVR